MPNKIQGIPISPLTGVLDTRSLPNELPKTGLRWRQNCRTPEAGKSCRHGGYEKLLNRSGYNNQDLHDQLLTFTSGLPRQPITMVAELESSRKVRYLYAGTQSSIYKLNEWSGNWRLMGSGYGNGSDLSANNYRFKHCVLGDYAIFTNGYNKVLYAGMEEQPGFPLWLSGTVYDVGTLITDSNGNTQQCTTSGTSGLSDPAWNTTLAGTTDDGTVVWTVVSDVEVGNGQNLRTIPDLDTIGVTRAGVCWTWKNCVFLADLDMDGERAAYRFIWSDYNSPISFDPALVSSIAGSQDLYFHEQILGGAPAGDNFLIYTTHGIWEMSVTGGANSFAVKRVYSADTDRSMCLFYPNTLVNLGDAHIFMGKDKIYVFSQYYQRPDPVDWIHKASGTLYDNIDVNACNSHIGFIENKEVFFSVAKIGDVHQCPSQTLRLQMVYKVADYLDFGTTSMCVYRSGQFQTIRDFFIENGICTLQGLTDEGFGYVNEGLPNPLPDPSPEFTPTSIYTSTPLTIGPITTEDYNKAEADAHSLCVLLGAERFDDICRKCDPLNTVVMVSSKDWCLKQFGEVLYREECTNVAAVGTTAALGYTSSTGTYILNPFDWIIRFAPAFSAESLLKANYFRLDYVAAHQSTPSQIQLRIGVSAQIADPNTDKCCLVWYPLLPKDLKCLSPETPAQHITDGTIPFSELAWRFEREGRFLYAELKISGTGGRSCFSGVEANIFPKGIKNC